MSKKDRPAWLRRIHPTAHPDPLEAQLCRASQRALATMALLDSKEGREYAWSLIHTYDLVMELPGLRRTQQMRVFYYLADKQLSDSHAAYWCARSLLQHKAVELEQTKTAAEAAVERIFDTLRKL